MSLAKLVNIEFKHIPNFVKHMYHYVLKQPLSGCSSFGLKQRDRPLSHYTLTRNLPLHTDIHTPHEPKYCTLSTLKYISERCRGKHYPMHLLDFWTASNVVAYKLGADPDCASLWDNFTEYCFTPESIYPFLTPLYHSDAVYYTL